MLTKTKEQRVGIFVDVQNMYYSAREMYSSKVDFGSILDVALGGRKLIRAIAYVIRAGEIKEESFFDALKKAGFEVSDWDIGIAMDTIELAPKLDVIVLVSGDGDFVPLVEHLRRAIGCKVEVAAFGRSASSKLKEEADEFVDMDKDFKKYLIKK